MTRAIAVFILTSLVSFIAQAQGQSIPHLQRTDNSVQLHVDGKPFLVLAGELHNSSASHPEYMRPIWKKLAEHNLNTVIGTASWELVEPVEGQFDFTSVDAQIKEAREHGLKLVLIWFGAWKSASDSYAPIWVKQDPHRFPKTKTQSGLSKTPWGMVFTSLSPFEGKTVAADAKAFSMLMAHIRKTDADHTTIMVQVENEPGMFGDSRDRSRGAEGAWSSAVPDALLKYMAVRRSALTAQLTKVWERQGFKNTGTWAEVFGNDAAAHEVFMSWHLARAVEAVTKAGKKELALPMFTNAWLGPSPQMPEPGMYPSGGPTAGMLDVWRAGAPTLDFIAPNAYSTDFIGVCVQYAHADNPLFVPETYLSIPNLFWVVGNGTALGYSPFGIEDNPGLDELSPAYEALNALAPTILKYQPQSKVMALVQSDESSLKDFEKRTGLGIKFADALVQLDSKDKSESTSAQTSVVLPASYRKDDRGFALVISTGRNEFVIAATRAVIVPAKSQIGSVDELLVSHNGVQTGRRLNGDETGSGNLVSFDQHKIEVRKIVTYEIEE